VDAVETRPVGSRSDLKRFIRFPWKVYQGDPNWVPPLILDMKDRLDRKKHPFFEHAEAEYFLAWRGRETVGRIAAVHDRTHNECHGETTAFFGFFECLNDLEAARALMEAASGWARERGLTRIVGPMNLSLNDECAFLLEGFDTPPVIMMPYNPRYYLDLMADCGLVKAKDLYAFRAWTKRPVPEKAQAVIEHTRESGRFTVRKVDKARLVDEALKIADIYNRGWSRNWGFVPWTPNEMKHMVKNLAQFADLDLVLFGESEGRTVGFAFSLPDYNQIFIKMNGRLLPFGIFRFLLGRGKVHGIRSLVFGVVPEYMHTGLAYALYQRIREVAEAKGIEWCELSWQLEDNEAINRFAASIGAELYKKYRIFEKSIASGGA
jgi:GNAT superfamily N-acetyltransferase